MEKTVDGCVKCGACLRECPVVRLDPDFPGPRRLAVEGPRFNRELSALRDPLAGCTTCGRCETLCPSRLPLTESMVRVRSVLYDKGGLSEGQRRMVLNAERFGRTVMAGPRVRAPNDGEVLFFPGCVGEARLLGPTQVAVDLLGELGSRPFVPDGWACCGSPLEKIGEREVAESMRSRNHDILAKADRVVTACPGCTVHLGRSGFQPLHIVEHLYEEVGLRRLVGLRRPPVTVTVHEPCHLARTVGPHAMDYVREILAAIPGVTVVEMEDPGECCGGGGGVASARPELAMALARRKVEQARRTNADLMIAPCPFCVTNLRKAGGMEVQDLSSFLVQRGGGNKP